MRDQSAGLRIEARKRSVTTKEKLFCSVSADDRRISLSVDGHGVFYFEFPISDMPALDNFDFAIWAVLPFAMRVGKDIHINGAVSNRVVASAEKVADVWEKWLPYHFTRVRITADETSDAADEATGALSFYSGGVDSTHAILKACEQEGELSDGLTVHGMDYAHDDDAKFQGFLDRIRPFHEKYLKTYRIVRTNIYDLYAQTDINIGTHHITHVFTLFAAGSIYSGYAEYRIASDHRLDHQFVVMPYGSNLATNRLMQSKNGSLRTMDDDISRTAKVAYLARSGIDLRSISMCQVASAQPRNCGKCRKCARTKANFKAVGLEIPDMFIDNGFDPAWSDVLDFRHPGDHLYTGDILSEVENAGREDVFPGYHRLRERFIAETKLVKHSVLYRYRYSLRLFMLDFLPENVQNAVRRAKKLLPGR